MCSIRSGVPLTKTVICMFVRHILDHYAVFIFSFSHLKPLSYTLVLYPESILLSRILSPFLHSHGAVPPHSCVAA